MNKVYVAVIAMLFGAEIFAGPIAEKIKNADNTVKAVVGIVDPLVGLASQDTQKKYNDVYKKQLQNIAGMVQGSANIVTNVEDFASSANIDKIKKTANELIQLMDCLTSPNAPACRSLGCTNKNVCIAKALKKFKELLEPIVSQLVAKKNATTKAYDDGALYNLVSLKMIPEETRKKLQLNIAIPADKLAGAFAFTDLLALILDPASLVAGELNKAEKEQLEASNKAEPVVIPEDAAFPSLEAEEGAIG